MKPQRPTYSALRLVMAVASLLRAFRVEREAPHPKCSCPNHHGSEKFMQPLSGLAPTPEQVLKHLRHAS